MPVLLLTLFLTTTAAAQKQEVTDDHAEFFKKDGFRLSQAWIYTDADRKILHQAMLNFASKSDFNGIIYADSLLEDHTHPSNVFALIDTLASIRNKHPACERKLEERLKDHLFWSEPVRLAAEHCAGNEARTAILDKVRTIKPSAAAAVVLEKPLTEFEKLIVFNLLSEDEVVVRKAMADARTHSLNVKIELRTLAKDGSRKAALRIAAFDQYPDELKLELARELLGEKVPVELRTVALATLGGSGKLLDLIAIKDAMVQAKSDDVRLALAKALSRSKDGGELLLAAATADTKLAAVLKDDTMKANLKTAKVRDAEARIEALAK